MCCSRARTSGSDVRRIISQTSVNRSAQCPACVQSEVSSVSVTPSPSRTLTRSARGRRSATSLPSNRVVSCDASQNGLRLDRPHRHRSNSAGASIGVGSSHPIGSPNSVSICAVRTSGGDPTTS